MSVRTTASTVTFAHPFTATGFDRELPAGTYRLMTDEEEIIGLSFLAFRRTATFLNVPAIAVSSIARESLAIDPAELDALLEADSRAS
ncbi:MAG: hypothetical protein ABTQ29_01010 [Siculibacillus sp.]